MGKGQVWGLILLLAVTAAAIGSAQLWPAERMDEPPESESVPLAENACSPDGKYEVRQIDGGGDGEIVTSMETVQVVDRATGQVEHKHFYDILYYLNQGDCLVLNNSKVLPARIFGVKEGTGAKIEFLLTKRIEGDTWETMVRPGKRLKVGEVVSFSEDDKKPFRAVIKDYGQDGTRIVKFEYEGIFLERLEELGQMPLPP